MDTAQWPQGIGLVNNNKPIEGLEIRKARPKKDEIVNCPRCNSSNTKFCYYNNYSLSQPRYFCKTCRRYWTEGGSLRNVPVGGGSRKNKRSSSSSSSTKVVTTTGDLSHNNQPSSSTFPSSSSSSQSQNPNKIHQVLHGQDLNLSYPPPPYDNTHQNNTTHLGLIYSSGFPNLQEFNKPSLNFSLDGFEYGNGSGALHQGINGARLLFPVGDHHHMKQVPSNTTTTTTDVTHGYWTGMMGGGGGSW